jgi:acyl-CoA reductase-like NAD-dependent aldehyde dehydrogenase
MYVPASLVESGAFFWSQLTNSKRKQINQAAVPDFQVSFGGVKQSGFGKDMGEYALDSYVSL